MTAPVAQHTPDITASILLCAVPPRAQGSRMKTRPQKAMMMGTQRAPRTFSSRTSQASSRIQKGIV